MRHCDPPAANLNKVFYFEEQTEFGFDAKFVLKKSDQIQPNNPIDRKTLLQPHHPSVSKRHIETVSLSINYCWSRDAAAHPAQHQFSSAQPHIYDRATSNRNQKTGLPIISTVYTRCPSPSQCTSIFYCCTDPLPKDDASRQSCKNKNTIKTNQ